MALASAPQLRSTAPASGLWSSVPASLLPLGVMAPPTLVRVLQAQALQLGHPTDDRNRPDALALAPGTAHIPWLPPAGAGEQ